jgi:arginase family enzyme
MFIVKVPGVNGLGKTKGCGEAGNEIIRALREIYTNEQGILINVDLLDLEEIHLDNSDLEITNELIHENALETFEAKPKTVFLGGDHSISYSLCKAFLENCKNSGKEPCLVIFDAHPDCMPSMKEPTHEEWLRALIEAGFPAKNIILAGVRNSYKDELEFLNEKKLRVVKMNQFLQDLEDTCDIIMEFAKGKELYLSIDIDVIDPAFAPGTGYKEPGGLTSREFIYLIQRINKLKTLRAVDIVEVNPSKDKDNETVKLGAKILAELL